MKEEVLVHIHRYLSGQMTDQEKTEMEEWIAESVVNTQTFQEIKEAWAGASNFRYPEFDSQRAMQRMPFAPENVAPGKPRISRRRLRILSAAAAVLAITVIAWIYFDQVQTNVIEYHGDVTSNVTLDDGTQLYLREDAVISIPKSFKGNYRDVQLLSGEVFFEVARNEDKPFRVSTDIGQVQVLGTSFNVDLEQEKDSMFVFVAEGKVRVTPVHSSQFIDLTAGLAGILDDEPDKVILQKVQAADINEIAWHTGKFEFDNEPVGRVFDAIEEAFSIEINDSDCKILECPFTYAYNTKEPMVILETLAKIFNIQVEADEPLKYVVRGGDPKCGVR